MFRFFCSCFRMQKDELIIFPYDPLNSCYKPDLRPCNIRDNGQQPIHTKLYLAAYTFIGFHTSVDYREINPSNSTAVKIKSSLKTYLLKRIILYAIVSRCAFLTSNSNVSCDLAQLLFRNQPSSEVGAPHPKQ